MACSVGVPVCLVLPLQCVLILTHEESRLVPAEMNYNKFPAPPLTCFYFSTPCKGKKFVIQLIPPFLRNSTDPLIPPPWSFKKKKSQQQISVWASLFHRSIWPFICMLSNRCEVRGCKMQTTHKQLWECPAIPPTALPTHQSRMRTGKKHTSQRKTPVFTEQPHFMLGQMLSWGFLCCWLWIRFSTCNL